MAGVSGLLQPLTELILLPDATTADSLVMLPPAFSGQALEYTFYISFLTGTSAGVLKVETAHSRDYAGVWPAEATVTFAGTAPNEQVVHLNALTQAIRIRVSTTVANGTAKVYYMVADHS